MLPPSTVPVCLLEVLSACRAAFTAPTFAMFTLLVSGALGATGPRTDGDLDRSRNGSRVHWSAAHRFFSHARWNPDTLGLLLARVVLEAFNTDGQALTVAVDDSLFHRYAPQDVRGVLAT